MNFTYEEIAKMIDHSLLHPTMTDREMIEGCKIAAQYQVASVCIKPFAVTLAADLLKGTGVKTGVTIGFPHGAHAIGVKAAEAELACRNGAEELDMVVNIGKVLSGDWEYVGKDIGEVVNVSHDAGASVKVIFENCYLQDDQKIRLCEICADLKADYVKTSTGFGTSGATIEDIRLMRKHSPEHVKVKAAGGIRTFESLLEYRQAGATRVGATATVAILEACKKHLKG